MGGPTSGLWRHQWRWPFNLPQQIHASANLGFHFGLDRWREEEKALAAPWRDREFRTDLFTPMADEKSVHRDILVGALKQMSSVYDHFSPDLLRIDSTVDIFGEGSHGLPQLPCPGLVEFGRVSGDGEMDGAVRERVRASNGWAGLYEARC